MAASDSLSLDDGMRTVSWAATDPLRIRVSMSAMGSVIVMGASPARLGHARHLAGVHHLAQADPAEPEGAVDGTRPSTPAAAGVGPHAELGLALLLLDQCLLRQLLAPRTVVHCVRHAGGHCVRHAGGHCVRHAGGHCVRHAGGHCSRRKGKPKASSSARPSALSRAVVTMVMSMPRTVSTLS